MRAKSSRAWAVEELSAPSRRLALFTSTPEQAALSQAFDIGEIVWNVRRRKLSLHSRFILVSSCKYDSCVDVGVRGKGKNKSIVL